MGGTHEPRFRGNTFLLLLLRAGSRELSVHANFEKNKNGVTRPAMFEAMLRIASPTYVPNNRDTFRTYFSAYLNGERSSSPAYYPFNTSAFGMGFTQRLRDEYTVVLAEMDRFCHKFLDINNKTAMRLLVAGIVTAIEADSTIPDATPFQTGYLECARADLAAETRFILQPFLLSVWHYVVTEKWDSSEAKGTYNDWTEEVGFQTAQTITTDIGRDLCDKISVSTDLPDNISPRHVNPTRDNSANPFEYATSEGGEMDDDDASEEPRVEIYEAIHDNPNTGAKVISQFHIEAHDHAVIIGQVNGDLHIGGKNEKQ